MTWTTIGPDGATASIGAAFITLTAMVIIYALAFLYRLSLIRRFEGLRVPAEGLEEEQEEVEAL